MKKLVLLSLLCGAIIFANAQTATTPAAAKSTTTDQSKSNKTPVQVKDLLKAITDNITKDYPGYAIKAAFKIVEKDLVTYEVVIEKGTVKEKLYYDKDGKFLHKGNPPTPEKTTPAKTTTTTTDAPKK